MRAFGSRTLGTTSLLLLLLLLLLQTSLGTQDRDYTQDVEEKEEEEEEDGQASTLKSARSPPSNPAFTELSNYVWRRLRESAQPQEEEEMATRLHKPTPLRFFPVTPSTTVLRLPDFGEERPFSLGLINPLSEMLQLLGGAEAYNADIMSYDRPWEVVLHPQGSFEFSSTSAAVSGDNSSSSSPEVGRLLRRRWTALQRLRRRRVRAAPRQSRHTFTMTRRLGDAGHPVAARLRAQRRRKRRRRRRRGVRLLEAYATCPVWRTWRDYGPQFWPRWVREGRCADVAGTSCSWPPGMHCVEAGRTVALILRYICLRAWPLNRCRWYRVPLPLVTSCRCGSCGSTQQHPNGVGGP